MSIRLAIAPDSWGVWFPENDKQPPADRCLREMAEAGFEGVELGPWGYLPNTYETLKPALDETGLELVAGTIGTNFFDDEAVEECMKGIDDIAALLGKFDEAKFIVLLPPMYTDLMTGEQVMDPNLTDEEWAHMCANIQKVADHCEQYGLIGAFHPHADCHVETEEEIERFLADTTVQLCLDIGHHVYGGGEPIAFYLKHADRIPYLHIKDCDKSIKAIMDAKGWSFAHAVTEGIMAIPGEGTIDMAAMHDALVSKGFEGWVTEEQDLYPVKSFDDPLKFATKAHANLKEAGF